MIQVSIVKVIQKKEQTLVVVLDEVAQRTCSFRVRYSEGLAIASKLNNDSIILPFTYQFMVDLLDVAECAIEEVRIDLLKDNLFYAIVKIRIGTKVKEMKTRLGDALALSILTHSPIFALEEAVEWIALTPL